MDRSLFGILGFQAAKASGKVADECDWFATGCDGVNTITMRMRRGQRGCAADTSVANVGGSNRKVFGAVSRSNWVEIGRREGRVWGIKVGVVCGGEAAKRAAKQEKET